MILEQFGTLDDVAVAKSELVATLPASGTAVLNADDRRVAAMATVTTRLQFMPYVYILPMRDPFTVDETELYVSVSVGISLFPQDGDVPERLLQDADRLFSPRAHQRSFQPIASGRKSSAR